MNIDNNNEPCYQGQQTHNCEHNQMIQHAAPSCRLLNGTEALLLWLAAFFSPLQHRCPERTRPQSSHVILQRHSPAGQDGNLGRGREEHNTNNIKTLARNTPS